MNKVRRRAYAVIAVVVLIAAGLVFYVVKYAMDGEKWAGSSINGNAFSSGRINCGTITDRNGIVLSEVIDGTRTYAEDTDIRKSTLHIIGDKSGNIGTGALRCYSSQLLGYNPITGIYSLEDGGAVLELSIDAEVNKTALAALNGRNGVVAVMNYKTGEIICEVSAPTFDPENPPEIAEDDTSGVYLNRFLSSTYTPGSTYKLVTLAAAIENINDLYSREFTCTGSLKVGNDNIVCTSAHGSMYIEDALAVSCNCVFAQLAMELGADTLESYASKYGLTENQTVDSISTAAGRYDVSDNDINIAWSGVGQYNDAVNPASMLRFVAAIANSGKAVKMTQLKSSVWSSSDGERLITQSTATKISSMMDYCVAKTYGDDNFPGLNLCAKSGTAEVGGDKKPNAWFVGFIDDDNMPYAFVVVIEEGGWGSTAAGEVANTVLQEVVR